MYRTVYLFMKGRYMKKIITWLTAATVIVSSVPSFQAAYENGTLAEITYNYIKNDHTRYMEKLDRGLVVIHTNKGNYLSWRLLGDEATVANVLKAPGFTVYKNGSELVRVTDSTNYLDSSGTTADSYSIAIDNGVRCNAVKPFSDSYFDIKLDKPADVTLADRVTYSYSANDASCGDLDGDGEYEIILKWDCNGKDNSHEGYTGNVLLDAYKLNGEKLWRIDLGQNIRAGAHYTQFLVYDFNGDGKAELACKTAPGSKDSAGEFVTKASHVRDIRNVSDEINNTSYVNTGGRILEGDEYYTVFGSDGKAIDTIYYPFPRGDVSSWGNNEGYGNRVDRFLGAVAYLDGVSPYIISVRGYYGKTTVAAMRLSDNTLTVEKTFTTDDYKGKYEGQGNHNMTVADVDDDGRDEIITGAICWDDDLSLKWCSGRGHGDALHIGNYDPTHKGLEYFSVLESGGYTIGSSTTSTQGQTAGYGMSVYDASTGEELFHEDASADTGRGVMADIGMGGYYQIWSSGNSLYSSNGGTSFSSGSKSRLSQNFRIFWDGDLYEELLDKTTVTDWNGSGMNSVFTATGCTYVNGTKANPSLSADILGDWREEIVYPLTDSSALRVFMTTDITEYKLPTLMHDPVYRAGVAAEQTAYNQPPHIGFYISEDAFEGPDELRVEGTRTYSNYITYSENEYSGWQMQMGSSTSATIGSITYAAGGRNGGDENTTFTVKNEDENDYIEIIAGRFSGGGRYPYLTIANSAPVSRSFDSVFETDLMFIYTSGLPVTFRVVDSNGAEIESFTAESAGLDNDKWYTYKLIYHNGKYYRAISEQGAESVPVLLKTQASEYGAVRLDFVPTNYSGGDLGRSQIAGICLDNFKVYTNDGIPVSTPTPEPTPTPTMEPTPTPTAEPTPTPTAEPTPTPTAEPTYEPDDAIKLICINGKVDISGDIPENAVLIEAVYNEDQMLISVSIHPAESLTTKDASPDHHIKFMLWDSIINMRPIAEALVINRTAL